MSYALRNTIILLVTLFLLIGGVYVYIRYFQKAELNRLQDLAAEKQEEFNSKRATSDAFPQLNETYQQALSIIENADKSLFKSPNPEAVYDYLNYISNSSANSKVYFDFVFQDSTAENQYGILRSSINGYGTYSNTVNFINKVENSQLLNKISQLSLQPGGGEEEELDEISFSFILDSYYERIPLQENVERSEQLVLNEEISTFNPFYPIILPTVPPNVDNLVNVEQSRLIGLTGSRVFVVDQNGSITSLRKGDQVYLGELDSIDLNNETATFNLNKGGITEVVTLGIER